jgi:hypothetical protein
VSKHLTGNWYWVDGWVENKEAGLGLSHNMLQGDALATADDGSEVELSDSCIERLRNAIGKEEA